MMGLLAIGVFFGALVLDYADARNTQAVAERRPHAAARWSVTMYVVGMIGFFSVLKVSLWLVIPECLGLYVGSWLAARRPLRNPASSPAVSLSVRYVYETRRPCHVCKRDVDAIRVVDDANTYPGLRVSRHLTARGAFCPGSLGEVEKKAR